MTPDELHQLFPNLTPIKRPPSLHTVNGIGTSVYGRRDYDPNTNTYVKTYCFCVLFIPVIAISAYRVADAENGGWYFLGKEPLSGFAKGWNLLLLCLIGAACAWGGLVSYLNSPERRAARVVAEAQELEGKGDLAGAVLRYQDALAASHAAQTDGLRRILHEKLFALPLPQASPLVQVVLHGRTAEFVDKPWADRVLEMASKGAPQEPKAALALLASVRPLVRDEERCAKLEEACLEASLAKDPADLDAAVRLATILETREAWERCEAILLPVKDRLGDGEGARILGHLLAQKGDVEGSFALLRPYVESHLAAYHRAEQAYEDSFTGGQTRALANLNANLAPRTWYERYNAADEATQGKMVDEYILDSLSKDPGVLSSRKELEEAGKIVPVALDLGIVRLGRAQGMQDPSARKAELEEAEKVFLAVSGAVGQTDMYRIFLGQVKYWLGKNAEGKALFDEYLSTSQRSADALYQVGNVLRDLGAMSEARGLLEESWKAATDDEAKQRAAALRAITQTDDDDAIVWLERANQEDPSVQASLAKTRGRKALAEGDEETAAARFREAVELHHKLREDSVTLNNESIILSHLYQCTGDPATFDRLVELSRRAEKLQPEDSILMTNLADNLQAKAILDVVEGEFDTTIVHAWPSLDLLSYLYGDEAGRAKIVERLRAHPDLRGAIERFEKSIVVAPRTARAYLELAALYRFLHDEKGMEGLSRRLAEAEIDLEDYLAAAAQGFQDTPDADAIAQTKGRLAREERTLTRAREKGGATLAYACSQVIGIRGGLECMGEPCDYDALVSLGEEAYRASPCVAARNAMVGVLAIRGVHRVGQRVPAVAELRTATVRLLNAAEFLALSFGTGDAAVRDAIADDADVMRLCELTIEDWKALPEWRHPWEWQVLRGVRPAAADEATAALAADRFLALSLDVDARLQPMDASTVYERHWLRLISGDEAGARGVLDEAASAGVPIPGR